MQAIEMMVFFLASVVVASLILLFIGGINPEEIYATVEALVFPKPIDANSMTSTTKIGFVGKMGACWEHCSFGAKNLNCGAFYITDKELQDGENMLDSQFLQAIFEKYNYCTGCIVSVQPDSIGLPAIVGLKCENGQLVISG